MARQPEFTVKVADDGRIAIPQEMRDALDLAPGDEVEIKEAFGGWYIRKVKPPRPPLTPGEFQAALDKWGGYLDLNGRTSDELVEEMRDPAVELRD